MATIDRNGISIETLSENITSLGDSFRTIYGQDINIESNTADGQKIGIFALAQTDQQELAVDTYNAFDLNTASGAQLDRLVALNGIRRRIATKSTVTIRIVATSNTSLPIGYKINDVNNQEWEILAATDITIGNNDVAFNAVLFGDISAAINTITAPVTVVLGVSTVTNLAAATVGVPVENDEQLRIRQRRSTETSATGSVGAITGQLLDTAGVTDAVVYENDTSIRDTARDIERNTVWCIVEGGSNSDIARAIVYKKSSGSGLKGAVIGTFDQAIGVRTTTYNARFDRPTIVNIHIRFNVGKVNPSDDIDQDLIKNAITAKTFIINQNLNVTELYSFIYSTSNIFIASGLEVSADGTTYVADELEAGFAEKFVITVANITITEI